MEDLHDSLEEDLGPPAPIVDVKVSIGCIFNSGFYDLALIQSFFWNI